MPKELFNTCSREKAGAKDAELIWNTEFAKEPDGYWLGEEQPVLPVETATYMLDKIQGFANVLRAMPWRIAALGSGLRLYTSDEPLTRIPVPSARWAVYFEHICYLPLSPSIMLMIGPGAEPTGWGQRLRTDLPSWHAVFANYMATLHATEFLYGPEPYIDRHGSVFPLRQSEEGGKEGAGGFEASGGGITGAACGVQLATEDGSDAALFE